MKIVKKLSVARHVKAPAKARSGCSSRTTEGSCGISYRML